MSIKQIDHRPVLVVIDLQQGIVALNTCHPISNVIDNCVQLIAKFRQLSLPIVFVNVDGVAPGRTDTVKSNAEKSADWSQLIDELQAEDHDIYITKQTWGAFSNTQLQQILSSLKITQLVICGIATSMGVESTARQAFELGYNITLPTDAMTDVNIEAHNNSVSNLFPKLAETGSTAAVLTLLDQ
ncbi:cysteine hydrolase family protein [Shewanella subflava]|uniref:Cysteine hydrolase n=1 Tax=Shewanella subflava TaxID=2986476 RepID=A0ABT3I4E0_9GAMM|nr:isochorismatase family cysteine hydrolase [Shewanella subflava]MCW3170931.1 cysteine hydrolase [Shewanella subflava]